MVQTSEDLFFSDKETKQYLSVTLQLYPTEEQAELIRRTIGSCRFYHNMALEDSVWEETESGRSMFKVPYPSTYKQEYAFLREVDSSALSNQQLIVKQTFKNHHKNPRHFGRPKYRSKRDRNQSYKTSVTKNNIRLEHNILVLPKVGRVKAHRYMRLDGVIKNVTIKLEPTGCYYAVVMYDVGVRIKPQRFTEINTLLANQRVIGLDMGLNNFIVDSEGLEWENPRFYGKYEEEIAKLDKKISHKLRAYKSITKQSGKKLSECKNYQKLKQQRARLYQRLTNRRKDYINKVVNYYLERYDVVFVEDLGIKGMQKDQKHSKSIGDVSWGLFLGRLKLKAIQVGKIIVTVDRYYPSSQLCNVCATQNIGICDLSIREWECITCGMIHNRDINAAINIKQEGIREYLVKTNTR